MTTAQKFQVGNTYGTRSICDSNCVFSFKVLRRTEKTITVYCNTYNKEKNLRVSEGYMNSTVEQVKPLGSYSMAPIVTADKAIH